MTVWRVALWSILIATTALFLFFATVDTRSEPQEKPRPVVPGPPPAADDTPPRPRPLTESELNAIARRLLEWREAPGTYCYERVLECWRPRI